MVDPFDPQQSESVTGPWAHGFPAGERQETHEIGPEDGDTLMATWTMAMACGEVHP